MRYKYLLLITLICGLCLCGCAQKDDASQVNFYYCNSRADYGSQSAAIGFEVCKEPLDHLAYEKILNAYLAGPQTQGLASPFPSGTALIHFSVEQQNAHITLSDAFAELTGIDLSIACACLSLTIKDMTGCANVTISAQNVLLDNQQSISIDANMLHLTDQVHP